MTNYFSSNFKLGILGGGQLGKMLLLETQRFDIQTYILDPNKSSPSKNLCNKFIIGDLNNFDDVYNFGKKVDVLTIEIEHINISALKKLELEGVKVFPSPKSLEIIKNKATQKDFYKKNNIPSSKYYKFNSIEELKKKNLKYPFVWKSCEMGYDGKGVEIIKTEEDLKKISRLEKIILIEECIDIDKELSVILSKNNNGDIKIYPIVEMGFNDDANLVDIVISPARINKDIEEKSYKIGKLIVEKFKTNGTFAVELFLTKSGEVLVNETAPRVHNSGHWTLNGSYTNQFEQHIRAILNLPLGDTSQIMPTIMINLIGDKKHIGNVLYQELESILKIKGVYPFIYGKKETKPFRKMGHINVISQNSIEEAISLSNKIKEKIKVISR